MAYEFFSIPCPVRLPNQGKSGYRREVVALDGWRQTEADGQAFGKQDV
jgi:hypothetical protein